MTGPQFDRNDPVGIMGSSPELMQAVMRNRPQLAPMETGNPFIDQGLVRRVKTQYPGIPDESDPQGGAGGQTLPPPVTRTPPDGGTGGGPQQQDKPPVIIPDNRPKTKPEENKKQEENKKPPVNTTRLTQTSLEEAFKKLIGNKSTEDFIKENRDLLEKYAPIPEKKNMRKQYLTKFFLDMAARGAQGDAPIAAAATAAPGTFDEYLAAEEKQKDRLAERDLLSVSMGLQDKKTQDASAQAINLKLLEIAADQPEKMKQVKALMDEFNLTQEQALQRVFGSELGLGAQRLQILKGQVDHPSVLYLLSGTESLKALNENPQIATNLILNTPGLSLRDLIFLAPFAGMSISEAQEHQDRLGPPPAAGAAS